MEHLDGWYIGSKWSFEWPCILRSFADLPGQSEKGGELAPNKALDRSEIAISLIMTESSLMAQSNSLLSRKNSLFGRRREFSDTALKLLYHLAHMPRLISLTDRNSLYFPS